MPNTLTLNTAVMVNKCISFTLNPEERRQTIWCPFCRSSLKRPCVRSVLARADSGEVHDGKAEGQLFPWGHGLHRYSPKLERNEPLSAQRTHPDRPIHINECDNILSFFEFKLILLLRKWWNKPHRLFTFSKINTQKVWTSRFWSGLKSDWLPAASHRTESDGVSHHGHQGLRSSDGGVQQLVVRQEAVVQVFSGVLHQLLLPLDGRLLVFAGVTGANGA